MHIPLFRQESNNIVVDTSKVFLSIFLKTCSITWVISYPEDSSIILYRITRCRVPEYHPDFAESLYIIRASIRFEKELFLPDLEPKCLEYGFQRYNTMYIPKYTATYSRKTLHGGVNCLLKFMCLIVVEDLYVPK
jgi:hypothetical protein